MAQEFVLDLVQGQLLIRDAAEPLALSDQTEVSGNYDTGVGGTGAITDGAFSTPTISFQTVDPGTGFDVFVDASFSQNAPATGTIGSDGNIRVEAALTVDLHVEVKDPPILVNECSAGPVNLTLDSTVPWDEATQRVTLADADFTVPEVPATNTCIDIVANGINSQLAGAGHSLTMTLEGDLELPPAPGCPTRTEVEIAPADEPLLGDEVTLTATVTPDPAFADDPLCDEAGPGVIPTGLVDFKAGSTLLGAVALDGTGVATMVTDDIAAGTFAMTATYRGAPPYAGSISPAEDYRVVAPVAVAPDLPEHTVIGATPNEFDVRLINTGFGSDVVNARLDITLIADQTGGLQSVRSGQVKLEYFDGAAWVPVTVQEGGGPVFASLSPNTGFPLPAGVEVTRRVRLGFGADVGGDPAPKPIVVAFEVVPVNPVTGLPDPVVAPGAGPTAGPSENAVGRTVATTAMVPAGRQPTTLTGGAVVPHTVRQGQTARVNFNNLGIPSGRPPGGTYTVLLDGRPVPARHTALAPQFGLQLKVPATTSSGVVRNVEFPIPDDGPTGTRTVTLKYSGDINYEPSQLALTIHIVAARGDTFACVSTGVLSNDLVYLNVVSRALFGSVRPSGAEIELGQLDVALYIDRGDGVSTSSFIRGLLPVNQVTPPGSGGSGQIVHGIEFGFGGLGTGTATATTTANKTTMSTATLPVDPNPDAVLGFQNESGSVVVEGEPGDVVPVVLDKVLVTATFNGLGEPFPLSLDCSPAGDPIVLGEVTIAGTTLTVDAPAPAREGDSVTLNARVAPIGSVGTVELRDGTETLTVVPVRSDGTATFTTDELSAGTHDLTARFFGGLMAVSTTSDPVSLAVLPELDCADFAEEGNGAVVRLVYMELLGRCPDQAGYDHWVARLEGGTSEEVFARAISRTTEAVGRVVDDAYGTMLGRAPDGAGRAFWVGRLQASGRYDQLLADLAGSGEFWALSGSTNAGFVTRVYERLLERAPEPAGLEYWVGRLDAGTSRKVLVRGLANLDEPLGRLVTAAYEEILGRSPGTSERGIAIDDLRDTGSRSGLYAELIGRPEFEDRAQDVPNPED